MEIVSNEIFEIKVKIRKDKDRKYFLENKPKNNSIGIIPFMWQKVEVNNTNKKLFLNKNYFLGSENIECISFRDKLDNETEMTYKNDKKRNY